MFLLLENTYTSAKLAFVIFLCLEWLYIWYEGCKFQFAGRASESKNVNTFPGLTINNCKILKCKCLSWTPVLNPCLVARVHHQQRRPQSWRSYKFTLPTIHLVNADDDCWLLLQISSFALFKAVCYLPANRVRRHGTLNNTRLACDVMFRLAQGFGTTKTGDLYLLESFNSYVSIGAEHFLLNIVFVFILLVWNTVSFLLLW